MKNSDVELVHRILDGDDSAFSELVKKYQKPVHALVWRKIGDFHIAEEITQDTFLKAYQKLPTLKKPQRLTSWLYVIAANNCKMWLRKKRLQTASIEETDSAILEHASYSRYVIEEHEQTTAEAKREVVKRLLAKLQESDRTVITLHYFGDMSAADIGAFLGVSVNTIKSRLRRAQQRLKQEEPMVREALEHFQITPHLTDNVMREVSRLKPVAPSNSKPLVPVAVSAATALLIFFMMGVGSQYLIRFQRPYNIDAQSDTTVEIIDASIVLDTRAKRDLRNQAGRFEATGKSSASGPQLSEPVTVGAAQIEKETQPSTQQQWTQAIGPGGTDVLDLYASSTGDIYAPSPTGMYRLAPNASAWTLINTSIAMRGATQMAEQDGTLHRRTPMAERDDTLYLAATGEVFASTDRGKNWQSLGERPKGDAIGLIAIENGLYLVLETQVFRSTDAGEQWMPFGDTVANRVNLAIAVIENTVFVGTNRGLYRIHAGTWEKLSIETTKAIHSLAVSKRNLYVGTGPDLKQLATPEGKAARTAQLMEDENSRAWEIFHSANFGDSWADITPTSDSPLMKISPGIKVMTAGETLLALGIMANFRSTDGGKTWTNLGFSFDTETFDMTAMMDSMMIGGSPAVTVNENTLIKAGLLELTRSTDGGESWHPFTKGMVGTRIFNLVAYKNAIYTSTTTGISKSMDGGDSWEPLRLNISELTLKPAEKINQFNLLFFPKLSVSGDVLYGATIDSLIENKLYLLRFSADDNVLIPIQGIPVFANDIQTQTQGAQSSIASKQDITDASINVEQQTDVENPFELSQNGFAVSGNTFYVEYKQRLFRWIRGDTEWIDTGLIDTAQPVEDPFDNGLRITVSAETVYVGKRDGHLLRSPDAGNTWKDLTPNLPLRFEHFNEIVFAGSAVYVATDTGVLTSVDGEHWQAITDNDGTHTVIDRMAVAGTTIYGAGDKGVYRLDNRNRWEQISPQVPDTVTALVVKGNRLYIATEGRGMFHISLENENN